MDVLKLESLLVAALATLASCYAPGLRDCAVSCEAAGDCAAGQVCGSDGLCSAQDVAGHCRAPPDVDGGAPVSLHVQIVGKGSVVVDGQGTCSSGDPQRGSCTYVLASRIAQVVRALDQPTQAFLSWGTATCAGQGKTCSFTPIAPVTLIASFGRP